MCSVEFLKTSYCINWQRVSATRLAQRVRIVTRTMDSVSADETSEEEIVVAVSMGTTIILHAKVEYKLFLLLVYLSWTMNLPLKGHSTHFMALYAWKDHGIWYKTIKVGKQLSCALPLSTKRIGFLLYFIRTNFFLSQISKKLVN